MCRCRACGELYEGGDRANDARAELGRLAELTRRGTLLLWHRCDDTRFGIADLAGIRYDGPHGIPANAIA